MENAGAKQGDLARTVSRYTLTYMLCSISELFHYYKFDPLDLLIIHAVLNNNVLNVMKDPQLDQQYAGVDTVEPDTITQRAAPFPEPAIGDNSTQGRST